MAGFAFQIIGAGRGGTSLMAGLIDAHPGCTVAFETHSLRHLIDAARPASERIQAYLNACTEEALLTPAQIWGHKTTTEQIRALGPAGVDDFLLRTANIPAIFIRRERDACVASKMKRANVPFDKAVAAWKFSIELMERLPEGSLIVRFEDLVCGPELQLRRVCDFLGVEFMAQMLEGTASEKMLPEYRRDGFGAA